MLDTGLTEERLEIYLLYLEVGGKVTVRKVKIFLKNVFSLCLKTRLIVQIISKVAVTNSPTPMTPIMAIETSHTVSIKHISFKQCNSLVNLRGRLIGKMYP